MLDSLEVRAAQPMRGDDGEDDCKDAREDGATVRLTQGRV